MKSGLLKIVFCACLVCTSFFAVGCAGKTQFERSDEVYFTARVSSKVLRQVDRIEPEVKDGGLKAYPKYNVSLSGAAAADKQAILDECNAMLDYDSMDANGNLFKGNAPVAEEPSKGRYARLFKHSAADALYGQSIDPDAKAVAKKLYIQPAAIGNNITGLYAPPGEIVTVILSQTDAARNMRMDIGQGSARGGGVSIPVGRDFNRMPVLRKSLRINKVVNYVGSPLGGPIYFNNEGDTVNKGQPYEVTVIGAVEMPTYIVGTTTDDEWERLRYSAGTLCDFEVYAGIRFTFPAKEVRKFSADYMKKLGTFWENAAYLSNKVAAGGWYSTHPVTMIYDTYVPAGAAVAFVGADFCSLPVGWAANALNYSQMMVSGGWGNLHEFNHHHQGWGSGNGTEVTNNVINVLTYMLFTNIGTNRTESGGLSGGNWGTDAYSSLKNTLAQAGKSPNYEVSTYIDIAHAFGEKVFFGLGATNNVDPWFKEISKSCGYDMTYYLRDLCNLPVSAAALEEIAALKLPMFVPVASLYQSGRTVLKDGQSADVTMGKPFYIKLGEEKEIDFDKYLAIPDNIAYEITAVTNPKLGSLTRGESNKFTYKASVKNAGEPDSFRVKLKLTEKSGAFETPDVELILEFMQNGNGASGKIWDNIGYGDIASALGEGFDKTPPKQTVEYNYGGANHSLANTLTMVSGKLAFKTDISRTLYLKGDDSVLLYGGTDINKLEKVAWIDTYLTNYDENRAGTSFTLNLSANKPWYYKMYILNKTGQGFGRIGWKDFSSVEGAKPVPEGSEPSGEAAQKAPIVDLPSSNCFKTDADINAPGKSDFYPGRTYHKPFAAAAFLQRETPKATVAKAPAIYPGGDAYKLIDGNMSTFFHSAVGSYECHEIIVDLGETTSFNTVRIYGRSDGNSAGRIKDYELYTATTLVEGWTLHSAGTANNALLGIDVTKPGVKARYIKILAYSQYGGQNYISISELMLGDALSSANVCPSTGSRLDYKGDWSLGGYGPYLNGKLAVTQKGSVQATFHGTGVALFAAKDKRFGAALVRVDKGEWQRVDLYAPAEKAGSAVFIAADLPEGYHTVEIKSDKNAAINVEYLAFHETPPPPPKGLGGWWALIILAFAVGACGIAAGGYFTAVYLIKRRKTAK